MYVPSVTEAALSKLAAIFNFFIDFISPHTASFVLYSLQYPYTEVEKSGEQGSFTRDELEAEIIEKNQSCYGDYEHVSGKGV